MSFSHCDLTVCNKHIKHVNFFYQNVKFDLFRVYEQFEIPDTSKNIQRYTLKWLEGFKRENVNPSDQVMIIFRIMIKVCMFEYRHLKVSTRAQQTPINVN